ncbi:MAG: hypothetical protein RL662_1373 [Bacteroidota bacterium]|jgi:hypothetical protein
MKDDTNKYSFKTIWSIFMAIAYIAIAYLVAFTPYMLRYNFRDNLKENDDFIIIRIFIAIIALLYASFRVYRIIKFKK